MSIIKAIRAQLGLSSTATQNFTLDASAADGTMKLARGNAGATTQDILTVDANGKVSMPNTTVIVRAVNSSTSFTNGVSGVVSFLAEHQDTNNAWNGSRFQPTIPGTYLINARVTFVASASGGERTISIRRNGPTEIRAMANEFPGTFLSNQEITTLVPLNGSTDFVEVYAYQNCGSSLALNNNDTQNYFNAFRVGD